MPRSRINRHHQALLNKFYHPNPETLPSVKEPRQKAKRAQPERELQEAVCAYLETQKRILCWANNPQIIRGNPTNAQLGYLASLKKRGFKKGVPDLCLFFRSKHGQPTFCMVELKAPKGVISEEQEAFMEACNERGGFTAVVRSIENLLSLLETAGY